MKIACLLQAGRDFPVSQRQTSACHPRPAVSSLPAEASAQAGYPHFSLPGLFLHTGITTASLLRNDKKLSHRDPATAGAAISFR